MLRFSPLAVVFIAVVFIVAMLLSPLASNETRADDNAALVKKGRAKAQGCTGCHGRTGMAEAASRAGVESVADYTSRELTAFKTGSRSHPIMTAVAKTLSDEDITLIALWFESIR